MAVMKAILAALDEVPEGLRDFYTEKDGKFTLNVDGVRTQADIDRQQGALTKERADHATTKKLLSDAKVDLAKWGELKPDEVQANLDKLATLEIGITKDQTKINQQIEEQVEKRIIARITPVRRERDELKTQNDALGKQVETFTVEGKHRRIGDALRADALKAGVQPTAVNDFVALSLGNFELDETTGDVLTKDGLRPLEYVNDQKKARPYLWPASQGTGAGGNNQRDGGGANPWAEGTWNMTEQSNIVRTDRKEADRLAQAAGSKVGASKPTPRKAAA